MAFGLPHKGTRRLQALLAAAGVLALAVALAIAIILNGLPYWQGWWVVMAALAAASIPVSLVLSQLVEWVIAGYKTD